MDQQDNLESTKLRNHPGKDIWIKSIVVAATATAITETGRGLVKELARHPLVMFMLGFGSGALAYKYRKEILDFANQTEAQVKNFVITQKPEG